MRTSARWTGAAVAVAAALLVSGCGSSDDDGKDEKPPAEDSSDKGENGGGGGDADADAKPGTVQGVWHTEVDGTAYVLTIAGEAATLAGNDNMCTGKVTEAGKPTLVLKCPDGGNEERTNGTVDSVEEKTLEVTWNGGDTDTYTKRADAPDAPDLGDLEDLVPEG